MENFDETLDAIKQHAAQNFVPILRPKSSKILQNLVLCLQPKRILEIGTATGYSALLMLKNAPGARIVTIEKDPNRLEMATKSFKQCGATGQVTTILADANEAVKNLDGEFDFVFLDGPKSHYVKQLPYLLEHLAFGGHLVADNVLFMNAILDGKYPPHKHRTAIFRLREFLAEVQNNPNLESKLLEIEDGLLICKKIK